MSCTNSVRDEDQKSTKILIETIIQQTVGYTDAIKLLMGVFGSSLWDVRLKILTNYEYLGDIKAATCICFDLLIHLFLRTKIIKYAVTSMMNLYTVSLTTMTIRENYLMLQGRYV